MGLSREANFVVTVRAANGLWLAGLAGGALARMPRCPAACMAAAGKPGAEPPERALNKIWVFRSVGPEATGAPTSFLATRF